MNSLFEIAEKKELEKEIVSMVWEDEDFKAKLLHSPTKTIQELFKDRDIVFPDDFSVEIHQEQHNKMHLVIPNSYDDYATHKLSDLELQTLAGAGNTCAGGSCSNSRESKSSDC